MNGAFGFFLETAGFYKPVYMLLSNASVDEMNQNQNFLLTIIVLFYSFNINTNNSLQHKKTKNVVVNYILLKIPR